MKNIYLLCGIPGSGKSTWAHNFISKNHNTVIVSRDAIRFNLDDFEKENYFKNEKEVFRSFVDAINRNMNISLIENIIIDATHLNERSRNKVLDKIKNKEFSIHAVNFLVDPQTCICRNDFRTGAKKVPYSAMLRMKKSFVPAAAGEKYHYDEIIEVIE